MAPPKRKTTGRVTPKGTKPGQLSHAIPPTPSESASGVAASTRYTPPAAKDYYESPKWVPILMAVLIGGGMLAILSRYVVFQDTNAPVLVGLGLMLGGLWTATKWR